MKKNTKRIRAEEPSPIDSVEVMDSLEFEEAISVVNRQMEYLFKNEERLNRKIDRLAYVAGALFALLALTMFAVMI